jgi:B12 binding domain
VEADGLGQAGRWRRVGLTLVVQSEVRPWRYPTNDFQYGDWLRGEFESGNVEPWPTRRPICSIPSRVRIFLKRPRTPSSRCAMTLHPIRDAAAHAAFDRLLADFSLDAVLDGAVLPLLRELGEAWENGEVSIAQEHFASHLVRGRLLGLARGWDRGSGPRAVLAGHPRSGTTSAS